MKKRNTPNEKKDRTVSERDPISWRFGFLTLICGILLVGGFFWAARQHFSAMDFGIKNAKLRDQKKSLEDEQRRLYLTKEISLSPTEIKKAARKIGLQDLSLANITTILPGSKQEKTTPANSTVAKKDSDKPKTEKAEKPATVATDVRPRIAKNGTVKN